jgi:hypothetical protein
VLMLRIIRHCVGIDKGYFGKVMEKKGR